MYIKNDLFILAYLLFLGSHGISGHPVNPLPSNGLAIETINTIGPNSAHNFTINAGAGITITPGTNSITVYSNLPGAMEGVARFVVDSSGEAGYTTVQSAIDAAVSVATSSIPQTVWIWPGTYTENIVVAPYVSLAAASSAEGESSLGVVIIGHATYTPSIAGQTFAANNITFEASGGDAFTVNGTESCFAVFNGCTFNGTGGNCLTSTNTSASSKIYQYNCVSNASSSYRIYSIGSNYLVLNSCSNTSTDTSSVLDAGQIIISSCNYVDCFTVTSGTLYVYSSSAAAFGSNSLFNVDGALYCFNSFFSTSAADWATGSGAIFYNAITAGAAQVGSGLTSTVQTLQVGDISFDGGVTVLNPITLPSGEVVIGQANSSLSTVASEPYGVLISNSSGVPSWLPNSTHSGYALTATSGGEPSWQLLPSTEGVSKFVVDSQGNTGYTTIQSAVNAALANSPAPGATTPQTIWIWPGTYNEGGSLDLYPWVNLASAAEGVTITGTATYTTSASGEYFYCNGIEFAPTSGDAFTITGTGEPVLTFDRCTFKPTAGNCLFADNLSLIDPYTVYQNNCVSSVASTYSIYDCTNTNLNIVSCNNESVDTGSTFNNSNLSISASIYTDNYSLSDQTMGVVSGCYGNAVASGALFSVDGTSTLYAINSSFYTAGTHWVTVATGGTLNYGTITLLNPSTATVDAPTLTTAIDVVQVGGVSFDGGTSTLNTTTLASGQIVIGQGNSSLSYIAAGADAVLITNDSGDASWLSSLTSGYVLISQSGAPPAWESNISSNAGAITIVDTDSGTVAPVSGVITISGGATGLTTYAETGSEVSLQGTLVIGHGGTGVTSVTTAPTATAFAGWDSNKNLSANSFIAGYTTTATAGGTTTLTVASTQQQYFTGSTTQTVVVPVTTTLVDGQTFTIVNLSSGVVTVQTNNGSTLQAMAANTTLVATVVSTGSPGTGASSWSIEYGTVSLTLPLSLANGGTGANLSGEVSDGGIFYSTATTGAILAGTATADQVLLSGASSAPSWSSATYPSTTTADQILYSSANNTIAGLATAANGVLITSSGGVPSISSTLPTAVQTNITELGTVTTGVWEGSVVAGEYGGTGTANTGLTIDLAYQGTDYVLTSDGSGNASWALNPASGSITTVDTDSGTVVPASGVITISGGATGLTTYAETGSEVGLQGTLAVGYGGTGVTSVTTAPTATAFAGWDSNKNLSANSFIAGYTTTATAGGATTLTVASTQQQYFTGSTTQTVVLPITTTLVDGQTFTIVNLSSGVVTVQTNNGSTLQAMAANTTLVATVVSTGSPGTGASSWSIEYGTASLTLPLSLANGGTGANLSSEVSDGGIFYSTATTGAILAGTATADQVLLSGANAAPSWSSATYPSTTTADQILYSSANNTIAGLVTAANGVLITSSGGVPSISSTLPIAVQTNITELGTVTTGVWEGSVVAGEYGGTGTANTGLTIDLAYQGTDYVLTSDGSGNASWALNPGSGSITTVDTDSGTVTPASGVITISGGATGLTTYAETGSEVSLEGTLVIGHGGTGVTSVTTAPTATAFAGWDSNKNLSANSFIAGYTTTAIAGGTTTLTVASTQQQYFTGSTTQTVVVPVTTTLVDGQTFTIVNLSSGVVTVQTNNGNVLEAMAANTTLIATVVSTGSPGTGASSWSIEYGTASLTLPLSLANGGTGANLSGEAPNGGIFYSTASTGAILAGTATADQVLLSGASSAPSWSSATYPSTTTADQILYSSANNTIAGLATAANGVLITSSGGVPSISSTLPTAVQTNITELGTVTTGVWEGSVVAGEYGGTGTANTGLTIDLAYQGTDYVLTSDGSGNASWALNPGAGSITTVDTDSGTVTPASGVITISGGATGLTTYAETGSEVSLEGTLVIGHGGTGVTSVTTAPTATAFAGWDGNKNLSANSFITGYTTTATAGGTTTLTVASTQQQYFTGSTTQTVVVPVTTTLVDGQTFTIVNLSSGVVTVQTNNGNVLEAMAANTTLVATVVSTGSPGTGASSWSIEYGTVSLTLPLSLANGGTGANLSGEVSDGGIFYSTATTGAILAGTATSDQVLLSGASSAPSWSSATYPSTTTADQILYSSANNTIAGLATAANGVLITSSGGVPSISSTLPTAVQTNITELGTVTTGVWEGSVVAGEYGGTGTANTGLTIDLAYQGTDYVLTSDGSGNASWALNPGAGSITTVDTDSGTVTPASGVITISGGATGLTTYAETGSEVSLEGTLVIGHGGTGVTSVTTAPTATAFAGRDGNKNLSANSFIAGYTTTATAGGTTTLTVASTQQQYFTGSTTQTVVLPITTTLVDGQTFTIVNLSSGVVTVQTNNGNVLEAMAANTTLIATVVSTGSPGTGASSWSIEYGTASLTLPLSLANGGTGANLSGEVSDGGIFYSTATTGAILAGTATADQVLLSGASGAPSWSSATYPSTTTADQILYSSANNTIAGLATAANGVLITSSGGVPSISSTLPTAVQTNITELGTVTTGVWEGSVVAGEYGGTGTANTGLTIDLAYQGTDYVLTSDGSGNASWALNPGIGSITTVDTDSGTVTSASGVITISGGATGLTTYAETGSEVSLQGTLAVGYGGTGVTSVTTAPTATAFAGWDGNENLSANSFIAGYTTTATSGGTTTLTVASTQQQYFTGSTTQTVVVPVTTTLVTGQTFTIVNLSLGVVTVQTNNGSTLQAMAANTTLVATVVSTGSPGTGASSWSIEYGTVSLTLPLSLANGGTGANLSGEASDGGIFYSTASTGAILAGTATADQVLLSGTSSAPSWSSATYPSTTTANQILYSSANNTIAGLATATSGVLITSSAGVPSILPNTTSGFVLTGQGTGAAPAWQALLTLDGDTGSVASVTPKLFADQAAGRCGSSVTFSGSGSTLTLNVTDSSGNTIIGRNGGGATGNFTGTGCTSIGAGNLSDNGGVPPNTPISTNSVAIGYQCLLKEAVSPGDVGSIAFGFQSLLSPTAGSYNACIGYRTATDLLTGSYNTLAGYESGTSYTGSESSNICLSNQSAVGDVNLNMIGTQGTASGQQNKCFIAGIASQTVSGSQVYINTSTRQAGLTSSSRRYKTNIQDMSNESSPVINLRPVTFNYNGEFDDKSAKQFGLIAEEVHEVMPEIVVLDEENIPKSVRYEILPALLLNEVQKLDKRVSSLEETLALSDKGTILPITTVSSSYTVLPTDYFLECDPSTGPVTVYLPDIPQTGRMFVIKDATGHADVNHITITTLDGKDLIVNSPFYVLNRDYQSVSVLFGLLGYGVFADYEGL